jgi:succinate-semialdehyde dehydrogenase/glutarate-semialdehyde dehydrogenase
MNQDKPRAATREMKSVNPADGTVRRVFAELTDVELEARLARAAEAGRGWRSRPLSDRLAVLSRAADLAEAEAPALGRLMTLEMGKPLGAAVEEARKCARACRYYVERAPAMLAPRVTDVGPGVRAGVRFDPIGPVLAVMPWNFPFWQVFRFAAPALAAGNVGLLKHASNVPECALAIEDLWRRAGAPDGVFQTLLIGSDRVAGVIADPRVAAVTLTGSEGAGAEVGAAAGRAIKKSVLELGGSDPFLVMPSADLERAAATAVRARVINNGQSCIAAKRFIVHAEVHDEFARRLVEGMAALRVGDPLHPETDLGPLATPSIVDEVDRLVQESVARGARVLTGGTRGPGPGNWYPPTVLTDLTPAAPAWHEEVFGPVALLFRVESFDEAISLANSSRFGLGASLWSRDAGEQERFLARVESGLAFVNAMVASDPRLPFGGMKRSGYGRELAEQGLHEFVNVKSYWVQESAAAAHSSPGNKASE